MAFPRRIAVAAVIGGFWLALATEGFGRQDAKKEEKKDFFGKGGFGGGGFGPKNEVRKILEKYDKDKNGILDAEERKVAREELAKEPRKGGFGGGPGGFFGKGGPDMKDGREFKDFKGGPGGFGGGKGGPMGKGRIEPAKPGPAVSPEMVTAYSADKQLYDPTILRTIFLQFENKDWEAELEAFHKTDVEVPALMTVDGKQYPNTGVHFRGMSSYMMIPAGSKRSLNLSTDILDKKQNLYGYRTLNLLNSHEDPSFLISVLYSHIARQYIPAPKANLVKVAINGESWGVYASQQQFNKEFLAENYKTTKGARWKVQGSPGGRGGLEYQGDDIEMYKRVFTIKTKDDEKDWKALIELCKVLNTTPSEKLEEALNPILDVDNALWFIALDNAVINNDGYWTRASDYSIYRDPKGLFHIIPHDMNECFQPAMSMGFGGMGKGGPFGGPGGGGFGKGPDEQPKQAERKTRYDLDPLIGLKDSSKPLRSKLLAVPAFREKYLRNMKKIAEESFDWAKIGPVIMQYKALIEKEVEVDTKKLDSYEDFKKAFSTDAAPAGGERRGPGGVFLKAFFDQRRDFLLNHPEIKKLQ